MDMKKRVLSFLLAIALLVGLMPGFVGSATAANGDPHTDTVTDSIPDNGISLTKSVSYDPTTGKVTTKIEAFTTGAVTSTVTANPTDIILVLDISGSMDHSFAGVDNNSNERLNALKTAVINFIDSTARNSSEGAAHSIAVVTFSDSSSVLQNFTDADDEEEIARLKSKVNNLRANGATAIDAGLEDASDLLTGRGAAYANREKVVIVFTDGNPTTYQNYSTEVAHNAVNNALTIKNTNAKIYTVGIFDGANPSGTDQLNVFMNYVSSNYPEAYGNYEMTGWFFVPTYDYVLYPGTAPYPVNTGYYKTTSNADGLDDIFQSIAATIGKPDIELGTSATLIDVVSDYFIIEGAGASNANITLSTAVYNGNGAWGAETAVTPADGITFTLTGSDTISVNGFNFDENYISEDAREGGFKGEKLILTFVTTPDYGKINDGGLTDADIITNDVAALLDSKGNAVDYIPSPEITANTVTYVVIDDDYPQGRVDNTYYYLPGAAVALLDKPADTAEYTYSEWVPTGVNLSGDTFTMPANDVTLTSTATTRNYTVTYTFRGNVPAGAASERPVNTAESYAYGDTVTHPEVTVPAGYTFSGWVEDDGDIEAREGSFTMPADHLHFIGTFSADSSSYKVEHYLMDPDGTYSDTADHVNEYDNVKTGDTAIATIPAHTGYDYDVTKTTAVANQDDHVSMTELNGTLVPTGTVLANGALTLKVYYARNLHTVTYVYDGDLIPDNADPSQAELPKDEQHLYGETVKLIEVTAPEGYEFSGWRVYTGDTVVVNGQMVMPDGDVTLHGSFTKTGDTPYETWHYFEYLDDEGNAVYPTEPDRKIEKTGDVDTPVYAEPLSDADLIGLRYDPEYTAQHGKISGFIDGEELLVLKLYYSLAEHTVTYELTGDVPTNVSVPAATTKKYGETVTIEAPLSEPGYTFTGWNITGSDIAVSNNTFSMPERDVVLTGHFSRITATYKVEHYLEDAEGNFPATTPYSTVYSDDIYALQQVTGVPNTYNTYDYSVEVTALHNPAPLTVDANGVTGTVTEDGQLTLKLYYTRKAYDIAYRFENNPGSVEIPAGHNDVKHGTVVDLADVTAPAGYTFDGWYYGTTAVGDSLTMPAEDVTLVGRFHAQNNIPYTVEYYQQKAPEAAYTPGTDPDTDYVLVETLSPTPTGTTGEYVTAPSRTYPGFSFNTQNSVWNGHIAGDGSLTLKVYYDRNVYTVSYYYFGTPPTGTAVTLDGQQVDLTASPFYSETVMYGAPMTVKSALEADDENYEFRGWFSATLPGHPASVEIAPGTGYTMPAANVEFRGALYDYIVYYNLNGGTLNGEETVEEQHVNWDSTDLLPEGTPQKEGQIFSGWRYEYKTSHVTAADTYGSLAKTPDVYAIVLTAEYADGYTVSYNWGSENIPAGVVLPIDETLYANGASYTVDDVYTAGYTVDEKDDMNNVVGTYTFSGWTDPSNGIINGASVEITGSWTYEEVTVPPVITVGTAELIKVDANDSSTVLSGVVFELHHANGTYAGTYVTDKNGMIKVTGLPAGSYYWLEIRSAEGYVIDNSRHTFTVAAQHTTVSVIKNSKCDVPAAFGQDHYAYIIGYDDDLVHPEANITRAEVATIFFRLLSEETRKQNLTRENDFSDVNQGDWFNTAVSTMAAMGIVNGRPGGIFDPNANITRAEFAAIAARFDERGNTTDASFTDIYKHWAMKEINIAANNGWIIGYEDGSFRPDRYITRAEAMTMVNRVLQRIPETVHDLLPHMVVWPDNMDTKKWYYLMVQEATNSHYYGRKLNGYEYWIELREVPDWTIYEK